MRIFIDTNPTISIFNQNAQNSPPHNSFLTSGHSLKRISFSGWQGNLQISLMTYYSKKSHTVFYLLDMWVVHMSLQKLVLTHVS